MLLPIVGYSLAPRNQNLPNIVWKRSIADRSKSFSDWFELNYDKRDKIEFRKLLSDFEEIFLNHIQFANKDGLKLIVNGRAIYLSKEVLINFDFDKYVLDVLKSDNKKELLKKLFEFIIDIDQIIQRKMEEFQTRILALGLSQKPTTVVLTYKQADTPHGIASMRSYVRPAEVGVFFINLFLFYDETIDFESIFHSNLVYAHEIGHSLVRQGLTSPKRLKIDLLNSPKEWVEGIDHRHIIGLQCQCEIKKNEETRLWDQLMSLVRAEGKDKAFKSDIYRKYIDITALHYTIAYGLNELSANWMAEQLINDKDQF